MELIICYDLKLLKFILGQEVTNSVHSTLSFMKVSIPSNIIQLLKSLLNK